jgi:deazaflavin-dependent oxidoreductase (nitroreductase family)
MERTVRPAPERSQGRCRRPAPPARNVIGMADTVHDFNASIIDEFRSNGGVVGGMFEGRSMLLLHTVGKQSGASRTTPLVYKANGADRWVVFASYGGAPKDPAWFHNLVAQPEVDIEVGTDTVPVRARIAEGSERDELWSAQKAEISGFADYEAKTDRQIPVVVLDPA